MTNHFRRAAYLLGFALCTTVLAGQDIESIPLALAGDKLSAEAAKELELHVKSSPDDVEARTKLLGYYFLRAHTSEEGDMDKAKEHLLAAGDTPGSPQLNSFGPNMALAKELLEKGERQAVLEYFKRCGSFWRRPELEAWSKEVQAGKIPDFGPNLDY